MGKINWRFQDEVGSNLNRYKLTDVATNEEKTYDLLRNANITTQGTPLNASNLNALITAINENYDLTTKMYTTSYSSGESYIKKAILYIAQNDNINHNMPCVLYLTGYSGPTSNVSFLVRKMAYSYNAYKIMLQSMSSNEIYTSIVYNPSTVTINDIEYTTQKIVTTPIEWDYVNFDYGDTVSLTLEQDSTYEYMFETAGMYEQLCGVFHIKSFTQRIKSPVFYVNKPIGTGTDKLMIVYNHKQNTLEVINADTGTKFTGYQERITFWYRKIL